MEVLEECLDVQWEDIEVDGEPLDADAECPERQFDGTYFGQDVRVKELFDFSDAGKGSRNDVIEAVKTELSTLKYVMCSNTTIQG